MSDLFFQNLTGFTQFTDFAKQANYHEVPEDWYLVLTDVKGSTKAIEAGRYKDVNTIGAATLAALKNAIKNLEFPFVFGGDGATAIIPSRFKDQVIQELAGLKYVAKKQFDLELRAGIVPISELKQQTGPVLVGKYLLAGGYPLAVFIGGALAKADDIVKNNGERYEIQESEHTETDLRHLSCRWKPLPNKHGTIAAVLIYDPKQRESVYQRLIDQIDQATVSGLDLANPMSQQQNLKYRSLQDMFRADQRHQLSTLKRLHRKFESLAAYMLFRLGLYRFFKGFAHYMTQMDTHSDFRKFDDMLRMVIDCKIEDIEAIENILAISRKTDGICYGIHQSKAALMTCFTPAFADGQHVHFIDGDQGGYAMAAKQLKAQIKAHK